MQPAHSSVISAPVTSQKEQQTGAGGAHVDGAVVDVVGVDQAGAVVMQQVQHGPAVGKRLCEVDHLGRSGDRTTWLLVAK